MSAIRYFISPVVENVLAKFLAKASLAELAATSQDVAPLQHIYKGIENRDPWQNEGQESSLTKLPCVICACQTAEPILSYRPGNWDAQAEIQMWGSADDMTDAQYSAFVEKVLQLIIVDDLDTQLLAIDQNFFFQKLILGQLSYRTESRCWVTTLPLTFRHAAGNAVPAN